MSEKRTVLTMLQEASTALAGMGPPQQAVLIEMAAMLERALETGRKILVCGNGGSAADAQHIAGELAGHFRRDRKPLACLALTTDTSVLTAVANDYGYATVFARQVEALGNPGDVLWALSTSGDSANVLEAASAARSREMAVVSMTGAGGGKLAGLSDVCFAAPAQRTDLVQLLHGVAYHVVCEILDRRFAAP